MRPPRDGRTAHWSGGLPATRRPGSGDRERVELLCVDAFPGIVPFHGLGQLEPEQLADLYPRRHPVTDAQSRFAVRVDDAFATQDAALLTELSSMTEAPLPWIPAAVTRWLQEQPDPDTGLGRLERLALAAIRAGCETPIGVFRAVAASDTPPQFWGDTTLWARINGLAARVPALVHVQGPADRLPQWHADVSLGDFRIRPAEVRQGSTMAVRSMFGDS